MTPLTLRIVDFQQMPLPTTARNYSIRLHVDPNVSPKAVHNPVTVPLHWQDEVQEQINADITLGVLEIVPMNHGPRPES